MERNDGRWSRFVIETIVERWRRLLIDVDDLF
jgi:hypothetical protein